MNERKSVGSFLGHILFLTYDFEEPHDFKDGNQFQQGLGEMDILSTQRHASTSTLI